MRQNFRNNVNSTNDVYFDRLDVFNLSCIRELPKQYLQLAKINILVSFHFSFKLISLKAVLNVKLTFVCNKKLSTLHKIKNA